ncbi:MAG: nucleotidyltransferase [Candidatus Binatia bacterium]
MQNFRQILERLSDAGIEFVIVGGYAALTHGSSFLTRDLDLCATLAPETILRLRRALANLNPKHRLTPQRLSFLEHPPDGLGVENLYLETDLGVIDILSAITGVGDFGVVKENAEEVAVEGRTYRVISLDDLIRAKEALGREKDLLTAKELRAIAIKRKAR